MDWESEEVQEVKEKKDLSKYIWGGIFLFSLIMVGFLFTSDSGESKKRAGVLTKHILIGFDKQDPEARNKALKTVQDVKQQLENGADFAEMAMQYSMDPGTKAKGGDLGWIKRGDMVANFDTYIFNGPVGKYSDPVETSFGFHIIYIIERNLSDQEIYQQEINRRLNELNKEKNQQQ